MGLMAADDSAPVQLDDGIAAQAEAQATLTEREAEAAKEVVLDTPPPPLTGGFYAG